MHSRVVLLLRRPISVHTVGLI